MVQIVHSTVVDPGFCWGGSQHPKRDYFATFFYRKLHENERICTPEGSAHVPDFPLRSANAWHQKKQNKNKRSALLHGKPCKWNYIWKIILNYNKIFKIFSISLTLKQDTKTTVGTQTSPTLKLFAFSINEFRCKTINLFPVNKLYDKNDKVPYNKAGYCSCI